VDPHERPAAPGQVPDDALDPEDEFELDRGDEELSSRLRSLLDPAADLPDRTTLDVDRTLRGRSVLAMGFELLGLGPWTVRALLSDAVGPADREEGN
jgi:hypothetical protein